MGIVVQHFVCFRLGFHTTKLEAIIGSESSGAFFPLVIILKHKEKASTNT